MEQKQLVEKIAEAKKRQKKARKFKQSIDFLINLKGLDLKKPENRFNAEFLLPEGRGKEQKICVIADALATDAKKSADFVITKEEIPKLVKEKKKFKKIANTYDWFLGEVSVMALIGKSFGPVLGPRNKVPKPLPPKVAVDLFVQRAKNSIRVSLKETPTIQIPIGTDDMSDEKLAHNLEAAFNFVKEKLPKGVNNVKTTYVKLTMGKPVKMEMK